MTDKDKYQKVGKKLVKILLDMVKKAKPGKKRK